MEAQLSFVRQLRRGVELRQQEAVAEAAATARQSVGEGTDTAAAGAGIAARAGTCCSKARSPAPSSFAPLEAPPSCPPSAQRPCDVRRRTPGGTGHGSAGQGDGYAEGSFGQVGSRSRCSPEPWRPTSGRTGAVLAWEGGHSDVHGLFAVGVRSWEPEGVELSGVKIVSSKEETPTASFDARGLVLVGSGGASRVLLGEKRRLLVPGRYSCW